MDRLYQQRRRPAQRLRATFPRAGCEIQVSRDGGSHPVWRADGRELFYLGVDRTMMAVPIGEGRSFDADCRRLYSCKCT